MLSNDYIENEERGGFSEWNEVEDALSIEIIAARDRKTEISLFDGKRSKEKENNYYYEFSLASDEYIDPNNIIEIRYKDKAIDEANLITVKNQKAIVSFPKKAVLPKRIPVLILVNDPSFIIQKLKEAIISIQSYNEEEKGLLETLFGTDNEIHSLYSGSDDIRLESTFDYNKQQHNAIEKAIRNRVLFIWGPPGTGKTTVLGKIISDYVKRDESVLLCSNTNRAVDVSILKALEVSEYETTPIKEKSLRWGNVFLTEEDDLHYVTLENHFKRKYEEKRNLIKVEADLLDDYNNADKSLNDFKTKTKPYNLAKRRLSELEGKETLNDYQKSEVKRLKKKLNDLHTEVGIVEEQIESMTRIVSEIEDRIVKEYESVQNLREFVLEATRVTTEEILAEVSFQSATFARAIIEEKINSQKFDNILIDEASMANLPYVLFLSTMARKRIIFVGDPQQLAPIVISSGHLSDKWLKRDIFFKIASADDISALFRWQEKNSDVSVLLTDQYRMPKKVFKIVNDLFYNGRLINRTKTSGTIKVIDTSAINPTLNFPSDKIKSPVNVNHCELLIEDISKSLGHIKNKSDVAMSIGVLVPFTQQKRFLQYLSAVRYIPNSLEIGVVHTFQGREKPKIYFDLTLSNIDFTYPTFDEYKTSEIDVSRLLNVALSRCQSSSNYHFDGEFTLVANIDYFRTYHPNGVVIKFIESLITNADELISVNNPVNPFRILSEDETQLDVFEQIAEEQISDEITEDKLSSVEEPEVSEEESVSGVMDQKIRNQIDKYCQIITKEIQLINHYSVKAKKEELYRYTSNINEVLSTLPVTYCQDKDSFKLFIDMMYKLIYESSGGKEAVYPVWDKNARYGRESYGKIRLVIHQLRQYYFHDYETWEKGDQDKLLAHIGEYFQKVIGGEVPEIDSDWVHLQLGVLFSVTEYLTEVKKKIKRKSGKE